MNTPILQTIGKACLNISILTGTMSGLMCLANNVLHPQFNNEFLQKPLPIVTACYSAQIVVGAASGFVLLASLPFQFICGPT